MDPSKVLAEWSSFYIMTGSSAAALTGLMFVVISVVTVREREGSQDGIATFSTPTVMHFAAALLVSALLVAPWHSLLYPGVLAALVGLYGLGYILQVMYRTRRLRIYHPDLEDWVWYSVLPLVAYGAIFGGAIVLDGNAQSRALFPIGGGVVLLIFLGIRNAWDVVTFLTIQQ